jgi:hypothetical protein
MKVEIKSKVINSSRIIVKDLYEGNDVSKRMGRILAISLDVLEKSDARFDRMREELKEVYEEMTNVHNKIYRKLGGRMGSGEILGVDIDVIEKKTEVNFNKLVEGVNPKGFMRLQMTMTSIGGLVQDLMGIEGFPFAERIQFAHWLSFVSIYDSRHRDRVLKIIGKYDPKAS